MKRRNLLAGAASASALWATSAHAQSPTMTDVVVEGDILYGTADGQDLYLNAYRLPDTYIGPAGISWLHRWAREKGREFILADEPKVPEFVLKASGFESE